MATCLWISSSEQFGSIMEVKFKTLPFTYRSGLIIDSMEQFRRATMDTFDWMDMMLSPNLFEQLVSETRFPEYWDNYLLLRSYKFCVFKDESNKLPSNSIIEVFFEDEEVL